MNLCFTVVYPIILMDSLNQKYKILSWNVRGMNNSAKRENIKHVISLNRPDIVCLKEAKMSVIDDTIVTEALGSIFTDNYLFLPADGTRGGILIASSSSQMKFHNQILTQNTISVLLQDELRNASWTFTSVYGPQMDLDKKMFMRELRGLKQNSHSKWLVIGDFNLICHEQDKSNGNVDRRMMLRFRRTLNAMEVKEISLIGKRYTWSNQQDTPTLTRIDRTFCTPSWEQTFSNLILQTLLSSSSDHCPIFLTPLVIPYTTPRFRFETYWTEMPGYKECVQQAWNQAMPANQNAMLALHTKLSRTSKKLRAWSKSLIPQGKLAMSICSEVISQLETVQEDRQLVRRERKLLRQLKARILGLAAVENLGQGRSQD